MKPKGKFFILTLVFFLSAVFIKSTDQIKSDVTKACSTGEVAYLSPYIRGFVVVHMPGNSGMTSAERCRSLLKDFFRKNPPGKFELKETGKTGENFFLIGTLWSGQKKWNMYFLLAPQQGRYQLQQIDIQNVSRL